MGLLDSIFQGSQGGNGLLSFLQNNAFNQPMPGLAPQDTAQYGPQPTMAPIMPQPSPSPMQSNAQMPPQQPPAVIPSQPVSPAPAYQPPDATPNIIDRFASLARPGSILGAVMGTPNPANITAKALLAKGADPVAVQAAVANPELMKTLVSQTFGPQQIDNLGSGYIRDKLTGKITRAYTPDDKTPSGFAQDDNGTMHFVPGGPADPAYMRQKQAATATIPVGFQQTQNGLEPIPGGPADPNYLRMKAQQGTDPNATHVLGKGGEIYKNNPDGTISVIHKNQDGTDATLSDDATKAMAAQYLSGDKSVLQNLGRGAQGAANIVKLREEITKQASGAGMSAKDIVTTFNEQAGNLAGQRTVGTRAANISLAANEANNMIPIALEASDKVPRGQWMPWNKMVQAYQTGSSSPELASFVAATNSLVNAYVRAVSPSGVPTDSMREHAYSMLNSAQGPEAFKAVVSTMQKEMKSALAAPEQVRKELRGQTESPSDSPKVKMIDGYKIMEH